MGLDETYSSILNKLMDNMDNVNHNSNNSNISPSSTRSR